MAPDFLKGKSSIPRRYVRIPKAQEELLNRPDAWSHRGFVNVPPDVLQGLKDFHSENRSSASSSASSTTSPVCPTANGTANREATGSGEDSGGDDSDAMISWSTSSNYQSSTGARETPSPPLASRARQNSQAETPRLHGTRRPSNATNPSAPSSDRPSRPPAPSPPRQPHLPPPSRPVPRAVSRAVLDNFPSSNIGSDADLEFELPHAITDVIPPKDGRNAQPEPSPPSAQVDIVPCTYAPRSSPQRPPSGSERPSKRRRRMKAIVFQDSQQPASNPPSSPSPHTSSSAPPPIPPEPRMASLDRRLLSRAVRSSAKRRYAAADASDDEADTTQETRQQLLPSSNSPAKPPPNGPASQVPFTAFTLQYPEYLGSLADFVRALVEIQDLEQNRALPEFLYDDFIRAFSSHYPSYVESVVDGAGASAVVLPSNQWYNEHVKWPLFMDGVITRTSVQNAVRCYPDEFRAVHRKRSGAGLGPRARRRSSAATNGKQPDRSRTSPEVHLPQLYDDDNNAPTLPLSSSVPGPVTPEPARAADDGLPNQRPRPLGETGAATENRTPRQQSAQRKKPEAPAAPSTPRRHPKQPLSKPSPAPPLQGDESPRSILSQVELDDHDDHDLSLSSPPKASHVAAIRAGVSDAGSVSIPETAVKAKMPPPPTPPLVRPQTRPASRPVSRSSSRSIEPSSSRPAGASKRKDEDPARRQARLAKFFRERQRRLQSSVPPSSVGE